jgi:hypothetical protein
MAGIVKTVVRVGVIGAIVAVAGAAVLGPDRVKAAAGQIRGNVNRCVDRNINDPVALRSQLKSLEGQYPKRIAEVRGDLAELREQVAQLNREEDVSKRVVALADEDLGTMKDLLARAEDARNGEGSGAIVRVRFNEKAMDVDEAYGKASRISEMRTAYAQRINDIQKSQGYLAQQETRLTDLLAQLESEHASFQTQLWQMDRDIDTIARNDRLIEIMNKRQATIDEQSRYKVASLDQFKSRFADIRARQESKLESLSKVTEPLRYEERAKTQLDGEQVAKETYKSGMGPAAPAPQGTKVFGPAFFQGQPKVIEPKVIEIGPSAKTRPAPATTEDKAHQIVSNTQ